LNPGFPPQNINSIPFKTGLRRLRGKKGRTKNVKTLAEILSFLHTGKPGGIYQANHELNVLMVQQANHLDQSITASSSTRTAGSGSYFSGSSLGPPGNQGLHNRPEGYLLVGGFFFGISLLKNQTTL